MSASFGRFLNLARLKPSFQLLHVGGIGLLCAGTIKAKSRTLMGTQKGQTIGEPPNPPPPSPFLKIVLELW